MRICFDDNGPDEQDRRRFTLFWITAPRSEIVRGKIRTSTQRAQCFFSAQWRQFLAAGAVEMVKGES